MTVAYDVWPTLHEQLGAAQFYERVGQLIVLETAEQVAAAEAMGRAQTSLGIESRMIGAAELREMEPDLSEAMVGALFCPLDGVADHTATTKAYAAAAEANGVIVSEATSMVSADTANGRVSAAITSEGERIAVERGLILLSNSEVAGQVESITGTALPVC